MLIGCAGPDGDCVGCCGGTAVGAGAPCTMIDAYNATFEGPTPNNVPSSARIFQLLLYAPTCAGAIMLMERSPVPPAGILVEIGTRFCAPSGSPPTNCRF